MATPEEQASRPSTASIRHDELHYRPRIADAELEAAIRLSPAASLFGPRGCGKTTTALQHAGSAVHFDADPQLREIAKVDPGSLLRSDPPTLLDEWRLAPEIFGAMRHECDRRAQAGQFILAGSAEPSADPARHAGEGRVLPVRMRTMSLFESGDSDGSISLRKLLDGDEPLSRDDEVGLEDLVALICRGGWPQYCELHADDAQTVMRGYVEQLVSAGLPQDADGRFAAGTTRAMLRSLARNESTAASLRTLAHDAGGNGHPLDARTAARYLGGLTQLHLVEPLPAWAGSLRSPSPMRQSPKRYMCDPALAVAALGGGPALLMDNIGYLGQLFESLALRDLRVYAQAAGASLAYFRDRHGHEVDVIATDRRSGRWAAMEIKLGGAQAVTQAIGSLRKLRDRVDVERAGQPAALVVLVGRGRAYRDGDIAVVPLTTLGP